MYINQFVLLFFVVDPCHRSLLPGTSLEPAMIPTARLQISDCSTFRITCDVPSTTVFLVNLLNVFLAWFPNFCLNVLLLFRVLQLLLAYYYYYYYY